MQAIETKYLPPTNTKPSRIKATCERGSLTVEWDHELDTEGNHHQAALKLQGRFCMDDATRHGAHSKSPWAAHLVTGALKNSYVHVFTGQDTLRPALELAEATIQRLAPDGSRATQGTRDVISAALSK